MRALVVYESLWGNTEKVARAIADELGQGMEVTIVDVDSAPTSVDEYDLLAVGGPTHAFSMSRPTTRRTAVENNHAPHAPTRGIREWLNELSPTDRHGKAVAFDTRVNSPRLPGSAARAAKQELRSLGFEVPVKQKTFRVEDLEGPLIDGELDNARAWAREVMHSLTSWIAR
jgi:hypothetical protein